MANGNNKAPRARRPAGTPNSSQARFATLSASGPRPVANGPINPPVERASTILYESVEDYMRRHDGYYDDVIYGLYGTSTTFALAEAVAALEGGHMSVITSSGTAAIAIALTSFVESGDHVLVADCVYGATRRFCEEILRRFGVEVDYFDPRAIDTLAAKVRARTRVIYLESPGSQTFEMTDAAAVVAIARERDVRTVMDNTWATPVYFRPIEHGIDVSLASATKYLSGHSDVLLGTLTAASEETFMRLKDCAGRWGNCAGPDECYLVHRGMRTLDVRLERHQRNARQLIEWLRERDEVERILYPALEDDPGHEIWRRDFRGASGLFGVLLMPQYETAASALFHGLQHFRMGSSWGGFESLLVPAWPPPPRSCMPAPPRGRLLRVHAGLEDPADLIEDLDAAFTRLRQAIAA